MARQAKQKPMDAIMAEPIHTPGFPQIIVTRGFAYEWFKSLNWPESERGFGSLDYMIFAAPVAKLELTEADARDYWLAKVADDFRREVA